MDTILQAQSDGVVIGLQSISDGNPVPRLDIEELLLQKPDTFNLFILALNELQQAEDTSDKMGYFQVAGIHGLPLSFWDGVENDNKTVEGWVGQGYCAHSRPTFPSWHRPYLAMMEQTLYVKMAEIAERYPDASKDKYRTALNDFRLPYWDYYRPRNEGTTTMPGITGPGGTTTFNYDFSIPQIFTVQSVVVRRTSDDQLGTLQNPLRRFIFPSSDGFSVQDWSLAGPFNETETIRWPRNVNDNRGDPISMNRTLNRDREGNTTIILDIIKDYDSYASFSSDTLTPGASGSLEDIHGTYHGLIGGLGNRAGHMSSVPIASFDPVFWMHHCQVDRWFAIWQAAHPDSYFDGQFADESGEIADIAPLASEDALPFRYGQGGYWNASLSQNTETFGYVYKDALGSSQDVTDNFTNLYAWAVRSQTGTGHFGTPPPSMVPVSVSTAQVFQYSAINGVNEATHAIVHQAPQAVLRAAKQAATVVKETAGLSSTQQSKDPEPPAAKVSTKAVAPGTGSTDKAFTNLQPLEVNTDSRDVDEQSYSRDWYVDNVVERLALNGSFTIFYFIGTFEDDNDSYEDQPTMAGLNHVFTSSKEACDNCGSQSEQGHLITGTKPITPILLDYVKIGELADITPDNVVPFLIKNLKWRIVKADTGERADPREVAGFKVGVSSKLSLLAGQGDARPTRPIYEEYPQIVEQIIANAS